MEKNIQALLSQLTLKEKASLCSGLDNWRTKPIKRLGIPSVMMADGPHGLRFETGGGDHMGKGRSVPATCFPTSAATACSWDRELLREIGRALGEEALQSGVSVLLGPGANIKRSPLCGRNFEYFSEDPFLSGAMASAWIDGVQGTGVGASLKHFAANNQEHRRMTIDARVDERALREIYLAGFEAAVRQAEPWTVMCAYNRLNGQFCSENEFLLGDVLRGEWGFGGAVITDWGACNDRVRGLSAGQDIEMPGNGGVNDRKIVRAVKAGKLSVEALDRAAARVLELAAKGDANRKPGFICDMEAHHRLARRAAAESAVLLKNDGGLLPLRKDSRVAVIGEMAKTPRYQGSGSSLVNPRRLETSWEEMNKLAQNCAYAAGYRLDSDQPEEALIAEACAVAETADVAVVFVGLPEEYEAESFDRAHLNMPESHHALIERVASVNPNMVVVLMNGAPVEMPWIPAACSVLEVYLGGEGGGGGAADVLFGIVNPSGKLAETMPIRLEDALSSRYFPMGPDAVEYRESVYVGYRWFDSAKIPVRFPFGHGLSYTAFEYSGLALDTASLARHDSLRVELTVRNAGALVGAEVVQLYIRDKQVVDFRPEKELKGFEKVVLQPGEEKRVSFTLDRRAFAYFDGNAGDWRVSGGEFEILIGASSTDIRLKASVRAEGDPPPAAGMREAAAAYKNPEAMKGGVEASAFEALFAVPSALHEHAPRFSMNSTLDDVRCKRIGRALYALVKTISGAQMGLDNSELGRRALAGFIGNMPLRNLITMSGGWFPAWLVRMIINMMNIGT